MVDASNAAKKTPHCARRSPIIRCRLRFTTVEIHQSDVNFDECDVLRLGWQNGLKVEELVASVNHGLDERTLESVVFWASLYAAAGRPSDQGFPNVKPATGNP